MARCWMPTGLLSLCLAVAVPVLPANAQETPPAAELPGETRAALPALKAARQKVADKQWPEAVSEYQRLLDEIGGDLAPQSPQHVVAVRWLCHLDLAALPPDALRLYRNRVDAQAKKWLDQGLAQRDARLLRRVVDEAFCSRAGEHALDVLGDLAFERGRFDEAEHWWRLLALPATEQAKSGDLVFPDPQLDVARVRAKQLLARLFRGEQNGWPEELKAFRTLHGKAEGSLAGRQGKYADILEALATDPDALATDPDVDGWPTFAGDASRQFLLPGDTGDPSRLLRTMRNGPQWRVSLQDRTRIKDDPSTTEKPVLKVVNPSTAARSLAFHPVIVGDQVLVADARWVTAFDLRTGESGVWYDAKKGRDTLEGLNLELPAPPDLRYTLTVAEDGVFARLGAQRIQDVSANRKPEDKKPEHDSFLVCLNREAGPDGRRVRWVVKPAGPDSPPTVFEGAPVVQGGRVYVAVTRFAGNKTITAIHCYPVRTDNNRAEVPLLWRQDVCEVQDPKQTEPRYRHHLLTLAGPNLVYCSHAGAIVAVDAVTGRRAWGVRYPVRITKPGTDEPALRDLTPCLYSAGRLFAAPADSDRLLCLDPATGRILWEREHLEVVHLLGVGRGHLIWTTPRSIRAVNAATGADVKGWLQPGDGNLDHLRTFGRGFLASGLVFWPTSDGLKVLNQEDGQPADIDPTALRHVRPGNLAFGNGCLVATDQDTLWAYVPEGGLLEQRRKEQAAQPESALACYRLALAEADAGLHRQAVESFAQAERLAGKGEPLRDLARDRRQETLLHKAKAEQTEKKWPEAAATLTQAAATEFAISARLRALARQAELWVSAEQPARAVAAWQDLVSDDVLSRGQFTDHRGNPQTAAVFATLRIQQLLRDHGPAAYATAEEQAKALLASAPDERRTEVLERLVQEYPFASITNTALLQLAELHAKTGEPVAAAYTYRLWLSRNPDNADAAAIRLKLARLYEKQQRWQAARSQWQELAAAQGDKTLLALDPKRTVGEFVKQHLQGPDYRAVAEGSAPLLRTWSLSLEPAEHLLIPQTQTDTSDDTACVFTVWSEQLACIEAATGKVRWLCELPWTPSWAVCHADHLLVAGAEGVACLRLADARILWQFSGPSAGGALSGFRLAGQRLFFFQDQRRLFALDIETGQVNWTRWAPAARLQLPYPSGRFFPFYHAGEEVLALQTSGGELWVLDSKTGRTLREAATPRDPWPRPPVVLDKGRVCLVPDARQVVLLDAAGKEVWTHPISGETTRTGEAPAVVSDGKSLLVVIARNFGYTLQRLDPQTGKALWPEEGPLGPAAIPAESITCDQTTIHISSRNVLSARTLADGKVQWELPLKGPAGRWRTVRAAEHLLAYPVDTRAVQFEARWLQSSVRLEMNLPLEEPPGRGFPILLCEPKSGKLTQRLNFTTPGQQAIVTSDSSPGIAVLPQVLAWRRVAGTPPAVQLLPRGMVVALDGKMWGLTTSFSREP